MKLVGYHWCCMLTAWLAALKLACGWEDLSWWIVLSPIGIYTAGIVVLGIALIQLLIKFSLFSSESVAQLIDKLNRIRPILFESAVTEEDDI